MTARSRCFHETGTVHLTGDFKVWKDMVWARSVVKSKWFGLKVNKLNKCTPEVYIQ